MIRPNNAGLSPPFSVWNFLGSLRAYGGKRRPPEHSPGRERLSAVGGLSDSDQLTLLFPTERKIDPSGQTFGGEIDGLTPLRDRLDDIRC